MKDNSKLRNKSIFSEKKNASSLSQLMDIFEYFYYSVLDNKSNDVKYYIISFYLEYIVNCLKNDYHIKKLEGIHLLSQLLLDKYSTKYYAYWELIESKLIELIKNEKIIDLILKSKKNKFAVSKTLIQILKTGLLKINDLDNIKNLLQSKEVDQKVSNEIFRKVGQNFRFADFNIENANLIRKFFIQILLSTKICGDSNIINKLKVL